MAPIAVGLYRKLARCCKRVEGNRRLWAFLHSPMCPPAAAEELRGVPACSGAAPLLAQLRKAFHTGAPPGEPPSARQLSAGFALLKFFAAAEEADRKLQEQRRGQEWMLLPDPATVLPEDVPTEPLAPLPFDEDGEPVITGGFLAVANPVGFSPSIQLCAQGLFLVLPRRTADANDVALVLNAPLDGMAGIKGEVRVAGYQSRPGPVRATRVCSAPAGDALELTPGLFAGSSAPPAAAGAAGGDGGAKEGGGAGEERVVTFLSAGDVFSGQVRQLLRNGALRGFSLPEPPATWLSLLAVIRGHGEHGTVDPVMKHAEWQHACKLAGAGHWAEFPAMHNEAAEILDRLHASFAPAFTPPEGS